MYKNLLLITLSFQLLYAIPCASDVLEKLSTLRPITVHTFKQPYDADNPVFDQEVYLSIDDILALDSPVLNSAIAWMPLEDQEPIPLYEVDTATLQLLLGDKKAETTVQKLVTAKNFLQIHIYSPDFDIFSFQECWQTCRYFRQWYTTPEGQFSYHDDAILLSIAKNFFVWRKQREIFGNYAPLDTEKYLELLGVTNQFVIYRNQESLIVFNYESLSSGCREKIDENFTVCVSGDNSTILYAKPNHNIHVPNPLYMLSLKTNGEVHEKKIVNHFLKLHPFFSLSYNGESYTFVTNDYEGINLYMCVGNNQRITKLKLPTNFQLPDPEIRNVGYAQDNSFIANLIKKECNYSKLYICVGPSCKTYEISLIPAITDVVYTTVDNENLHASIVKIENNIYGLFIFDTATPEIFRYWILPEQPVLAPQISSDGRAITVLTTTMTVRYTKDYLTNRWQDDTSYRNHELVTCSREFDIQPISDFQQAVISEDGLTLATRNAAGIITIWEKFSLYDILQLEHIV